MLINQITLIKCLIVDDEVNSIKTISQLLSYSTHEIDIVGTSQNINNAIEQIKSKKIDLIFLDINLNGELSFPLIHHANQYDIDIVFITAFNEYAIKAFELSATDYLLKPFSINRLDSAIQKHINKRNNLSIAKTDKIALQLLKGFQFVKITNILYCEAHGAYSKFFIKEKASIEKILVSKPLSYFEKELTLYNIHRVHKSFMVNFHQVKKYERKNFGCLIIEGGYKIPISRMKKEYVKNLLAI